MINLKNIFDTYVRVDVVDTADIEQGTTRLMMCPSWPFLFLLILSLKRLNKAMNNVIGEQLLLEGVGLVVPLSF